MVVSASGTGTFARPPETVDATTLDLLRSLVAFDTTSHRSNLECIGWIESYLARFGIGSERFYDDTGLKANMLATIGPRDEPGYVLSGHTDVVPVDGQDWSSDPFDLTVRDGRAFGRGACDMKGFLACCLAAVPAMVEAPLRRPIHLAFSFDEEVGCTGVRFMLRALAARGATARACFVGEPTSMQVVTGHKGGRRVRVAIRGKACHSSLAPQGVNAIEWGARLIAHVRNEADRIAEAGPHDPLYDVGHTTLHVGLFKGGIASNIVPDSAEFTFEVRALGSEDPAVHIAGIRRHADEVLAPRMRAIDPQAGFTFTETQGIPALEIAPDHEAVTLAKRLAGRNDHAKVAYGTEGGLFQQMLGVPTVVIGPGSIEQAHKPDEFIALDQLARCDDFIRHLIDHASGRDRQ